MPLHARAKYSPVFKPDKNCVLCNTKGARIKLDASYYMTGGRKITHERLDSLRTDDGRTLRRFLADEAAKPLEER